MQIQTFIFGFLLSSLFGAVFHVWKGGKLWRLLVFLILAWVGFWGGHFLGIRTGIKFFPIGPLNAGPAVLLSLVLLFGGYWLIFGRLESAAPGKS